MKGLGSDLTSVGFDGANELAEEVEAVVTWKSCTGSSACGTLVGEWECSAIGGEGGWGGRDFRQGNGDEARADCFRWRTLVGVVVVGKLADRRLLPLPHWQRWHWRA